MTSAVICDFSEEPPIATEQEYLNARSAYDVNDQGYSEIMFARPDTIAAALNKSPAGLLAWMIDKYATGATAPGDLEINCGRPDQSIGDDRVRQRRRRCWSTAVSNTGLWSTP